jgi:competence protein ComGD
MNVNTKKHKFLIREDGFTLLEMLFVLFILSVMLSAIPPIFHSIQQTINQTNFIHQFQADLYYAQSYAISHRRRISFKYDFTNKMYTLSAPFDEVILERQLPNDVTIERGSLTDFYFKGDGNVNRFGYIYLTVEGKQYRLFISIGRGRFIVYDS